MGIFGYSVNHLFNPISNLEKSINLSSVFTKGSLPFAELIHRLRYLAGFEIKTC